MKKTARLIASFLAAVLCLIMTGNGNAAERQNPAGPAAEGEYVIGVGDVLEIQVWKEPDLSKLQAVRTDGRISLPLVGDTEAAGRTPAQLSAFLEQQLDKVVNEPVVSVMLKENRSSRYYVVGQIKQPGEFSLDYPLTVLQAIARSGGFLEWAKTAGVLVIRRGNGREDALLFNYETFVRDRTQADNFLIRPGDTIIVP